MSVFDFTDYKDFIREQIALNKMTRGYQSVLAETMGSQKAFFSQVMNSHVHLSADHALALTQFWDMNEKEATYFLDLVLYERAATSKLKYFLKQRLDKTRQKQTEPTERFQWPRLENEQIDHQVYYSSWFWSAIHLILEIPSYKTAAQISCRLQLPEPTVKQALEWLRENKLILKEGSQWQNLQTFVYLPNPSTMLECHHTNWRQRSLQNIQKQDATAIHYSSVFTLSREDFHALKLMITNFIETMNHKIGPSKPEELYSFNCDFFEV